MKARERIFQASLTVADPDTRLWGTNYLADPDTRLGGTNNLADPDTRLGGTSHLADPDMWLGWPNLICVSRLFLHWSCPALTAMRYLLHSRDCRVVALI